VASGFVIRILRPRLSRELPGNSVMLGGRWGSSTLRQAKKPATEAGHDGKEANLILRSDGYLPRGAGLELRRDELTVRPNGADRQWKEDPPM
jgi:hypothetical protein